MVKLLDILKEIATPEYSNWVVPSIESLKREFDIEHERKGRNWWKDENSFLNAVKKARPTVITKAMDDKIYSRSQTGSYEELLDLIKGYRSYPKYRNKDTLKNLYQRFKQKKEMDMPLVAISPDNEMEVMSGNTRMDVAFQLGINPKVLLVKTDF